MEGATDMTRRFSGTPGLLLVTQRIVQGRKILELWGEVPEVLVVPAELEQERDMPTVMRRPAGPDAP